MEESATLQQINNTVVPNTVELEVNCSNSRDVKEKKVEIHKSTVEKEEQKELKLGLEEDTVSNKVLKNNLIKEKTLKSNLDIGEKDNDSFKNVEETQRCEVERSLKINRQDKKCKEQSKIIDDLSTTSTHTSNQVESNIIEDNDKRYDKKHLINNEINNISKLEMKVSKNVIQISKRQMEITELERDGKSKNLTDKNFIKNKVDYINEKWEKIGSKVKE